MELEYRKIVPLTMNRPASAKYLNDSLIASINRGYSEFIIDIDESSTYPNVCVPVSGIIDYYRNKGIDIGIDFPTNARSYIKHTKFDEPQVVEDYMGSIELEYPFDKVWSFTTPDGVFCLVNSFIKSVRMSTEIAPGVLSSIEWCINEVMDNVLQHADCNKGYVMGQLHHETKLLNFCIFDTGQGIFNSLKPSKHNPKGPLDAITLALQERVTRDERIGQGNGLWGLVNIVKENGGQIKVSSGGATFSSINNVISTVQNGDFNLGRSTGTSLIDFQLDYSKEIDVIKALNGYKPTDIWLENFEDENDNITFLVSDVSSGTGTRKSGERLRNLITNTIRDTKQRVVLDFNGINLVSSSFADEVIGKIVASHGFVFFNSFVSLTHLTQTNTSIINRSVAQRLAQTISSDLHDFAHVGK